MTIEELAEMERDKAVRWVRRTATKHQLQSMLELHYAVEIEDYNKSELVQALFDAWVDGSIGTRKWNRVRLQREIIDLADEWRSTTEGEDRP